MSGNITEYCLGINEFNRPKSYKKEAATYILLARLILLNPGTYPTHPKMGVGLVKRYRYGDQNCLPELRSEIQSQIEQYLPQFSNIDVELELHTNKELHIRISVNEVLYEMTYNPDTFKLSDL